MSVLEVRGLSVAYGSGRRAHTVVDDVDLVVPAGTTLGLVGESGSGKSSIAAAVVGLVRPSSGAVLVDGIDVLAPTPAALTARRSLQLVFQDASSALDPRMTVGASIAEATRATGRTWTRAARTARVRELLEAVGIEPRRADDLPMAFSGGQRQRITIARALAGEPSVLVADEITSALDVSVQGSVLNLLRDLQRELGLTILFISHNLAVVRYISDRIAVMRGGRIVECDDTEALLASPSDPYTRDLLAAVPVLGQRLEDPAQA